MSKPKDLSCLSSNVHVLQSSKWWRVDECRATTIKQQWASMKQTRTASYSIRDLENYFQSRHSSNCVWGLNSKVWADIFKCRLRSNIKLCLLITNATGSAADKPYFYVVYYLHFWVLTRTLLKLCCLSHFSNFIWEEFIFALGLAFISMNLYAKTSSIWSCNCWLKLLHSLLLLPLNQGYSRHSIPLLCFVISTQSQLCWSQLSRRRKFIFLEQTTQRNLDLSRENCCFLFDSSILCQRNRLSETSLFFNAVLLHNLRSQDMTREKFPVTNVTCWLGGDWTTDIVIGTYLLSTCWLIEQAIQKLLKFIYLAGFFTI